MLNDQRISAEQRSLFCFMGALIVMTPHSAHAYIGPGLSVGAIVISLIVLFSIILAIYALVWFPIKRRLKRKPSINDENRTD